MAEFLYVHIPFCIKKCIYCDFLSAPYEESRAERYIYALCAELELKKAYAGPLKTVYIGGGTPTVLPEESFRKLFKCLKNIFKYYPIEITVEANPGTVDNPKTDALLYLGVNRVSLGAQSFNDDELRTLGRIHSAEDVFKSVETIKNAGLGNFSIDLMYGIPGQTLNSWKKTLTKAVELSPAHISSYELTPEKNTPLHGLLESEKIRMPDEEIVFEMYGYAIDFFEKHGYEHYEISNFALPGFRCIHNINYWDRGEYVGAGAGAHSFVNGVRSKNTGDIDEYIRKLNSGVIPETEILKLAHSDIIKEFIFLGLRKAEGIGILKAKKLGINIPDSFDEIIAEGYLELSGDYLRLTKRGIVISNTIIVKMFDRLKID